MTPDAKTAVLGFGGSLATLTAAEINSLLATAIAVVTLVGLIPRALLSWRDYLRARREKTRPPFPPK